MDVRSAISSLSHITRAGDWRFSFVPFIIGCVYLWVLWFGIPFSSGALLFLLLSLCTTFGFAALGYYINEFFDRHEDRRAGKLNKLEMLPLWGKFLLLLGILGLTSLPWLGLPVGEYTLPLIAGEVGLFLLYSLPLTRLKKRPYVSGIVDASYAYVLPLLLSSYTYCLYRGIPLPAGIALFLVSVFFIGARNISIHHINDIFRDLKSGNVTLPQKLGPKKTTTFLVVLFVLEFLFFCLFFGWASFRVPLLWVWLVFYLLFILFHLYRHRADINGPYLGIRPARHLPDAGYQLWFPLVMLGLLLVVDARWALILPFHGLLLLPHFSWQKAGQKMRWVWGKMQVYVFIPVKVAVNHFIYWFFRIFGVDLVKKNTSALGFIKRKLGK